MTRYRGIIIISRSQAAFLDTRVPFEFEKRVINMKNAGRQLRCPALIHMYNKDFNMKNVLKALISMFSLITLLTVSACAALKLKSKSPKTMFGQGKTKCVLNVKSTERSFIDTAFFTAVESVAFIYLRTQVTQTKQIQTGTLMIVEEEAPARETRVEYVCVVQDKVIAYIKAYMLAGEDRGHPLHLHSPPSNVCCGTLCG